MGDLTRLDDLCLSLVLAKLDDASIVALQMTCRGFWEFTVRRDAYVWLLKLKREFDYRITGGQEVPPDYLGMYRRLARKSQRPETLRFVGVYTNGSVDPVSPRDLGMWPGLGHVGQENDLGSRMKTYWADNAFKEEMSPFCSVVGQNVDVVGVLLDGHAALLRRERGDRAYMQRRTRFARFWLRRLAEEGGLGQNLDEVFPGDFPTDHQLRSFFLSILEWYELGRGIGQTLFIEADDEDDDEDDDGADGGLDQLVEARGVRERLLAENRHLGRAIVADPTYANVVYDSSLIDGLVDGSRSYRRCVAERFIISQAGELTCPVKSGFVFGAVLGSRPVGNLDGGRDAWVSKMQQSLGALRAYENIMRLDMVMELCDQGLLPGIEAIHLCESGDESQDTLRGSVFVEFTREELGDGCVDQWFPIGFFLFDVGWRNGPSAASNARDLTELAGRQVSSSVIEIHRSDSDHDVHAEDAEDLLYPPPDPRTEMNVRLQLRRMLDALAIKLVTQENRMQEMEDSHEAPNIDLTRFLCQGICMDPDARATHRYLTRAATAASGDVARR